MVDFKYNPISTEVNAESTMVKASDIIDITVGLAIQKGDLEALLSCANAYAQISQLLAGPDEPEVTESNSTETPFGFSGLEIEGDCDDGS